MLRLLSWSSGLAAEKITSHQVDCLASRRHRSPTVDLHKQPMLKRKRVDSGETGWSQGPTKRRMEKLSQTFVPRDPVPISPVPVEEPSCPLAPATNINESFFTSEIQDVDQPKMEGVQSTQADQAHARNNRDRENLRQTLSSQISLEILLKHKELRLIDQEIAKCQIALEQLRRCSEIPYPVTALSQAVSLGQGPVVRSSRSAVPPESPAPWGVTDGPYTRHYAKWLLPDPLFDGADLPARSGSKIPAGKTPTKGRSTRGSFTDSSTATGKSKAQRTGKFQALSSGYPQPKDKAGPMIQKRKSDGQLVKLVCLDCRRDNFSSAQGFINHCRIAHSRNFASHDAAADACGEPVDVDEAGAVLGGEGPPSASMAGLVHPLIYSAHTLKQETPKKTPYSEPNGENDATSATSSSSELGGAETCEHWPTPQLTASPITPNLSKLMQRRGANLDLQGLVEDMKTPFPMDETSESEEEDDEDISIPEAPVLGRHPHLTGSMQPARSTVSLVPPNASPTGHKGINGPRLPHSLPGQSLVPPAQAPLRSIAPASYTAAVHSDGPERSPTNDSNQAPSLVDDDGDDECEAHSPSCSDSGSADAEHRDLAFEVEDGEESGPSAQNRSTDSDYSGTPKQHPQPAPAKRASAFRRSVSGREEKHVSFVSPSPAREVEPSKKGGDRRRRRTGSGR